MTTRRYGHLLVTVTLIGTLMGTVPIASPQVSAALPSSGRVCFSVAGHPGDAAIVNLTPVRATASGNGQLISSDITTPPTAANVNFAPGTIDPNVAIAQIGTDGKVCFQNSEHATVDIIADHLGTIAASAYTPATPNGAPDRKADTRNTTSIAPSGRVCFSVAGHPGDAAIVNLTPVRATASGNGQLISSDITTPPTAANVNFAPGTIDPNVAIAQIGTDGKVCFQNSEHATVDIIADHLGTIAASAYTPATPNGAPDRKADTRNEVVLSAPGIAGFSDDPWPLPGRIVFDLACAAGVGARTTFLQAQLADTPDFIQHGTPYTGNLDYLVARTQLPDDTELDRDVTSFYDAEAGSSSAYTLLYHGRDMNGVVIDDFDHPAPMSVAFDGATKSPSVVVQSRFHLTGLPSCHELDASQHRTIGYREVWQLGERLMRAVCEVDTSTYLEVCRRVID